MEQLADQGIKVWADDGKLKINSPKGLMTAQLQSELASNKAEILEFCSKICCSRRLLRPQQAAWLLSKDSAYKPLAD